MLLSRLWNEYLTYITQGSAQSVSSDLHANPNITQITHDSRMVSKHTLYIVLPGRNTHGANYISQAITKGAVAIAIPQDEPIPKQLPPSFPYITLKNPRHDMAVLADLIYEQSQAQLQLIGVTGTNGKTTTSSLLSAMIKSEYGDVGLLGTVVNSGGGKTQSATLTTMESPTLHQYFSHLVGAKVKHCIMEVSSIGLCEARVAACRFNRAAFLNLSEDHLDYHGSMEQYAHAKMSLFTQHLSDDAEVIINIDDPFGPVIVQKLTSSKITPARMYTLSLFNQQADIYWKDLEHHTQGIRGTLHTPWETLYLASSLWGEFNAYNLAMACGLAYSLQVSSQVIKKVLYDVQVTGRMQQVDSSFYANVLVDYAHTPDALYRVLKSLKDHSQGQLYCIFGCGGDRDAAKRSLMGQAASLADVVILTNDNPRFEDPLSIAYDALQGLEQEGYLESSSIQKGRTWIELDRKNAIQEAIYTLKPTDTLLIAGKGHETYQEIQGQKYPFNDVEHAQLVIQTLKDLMP